MDHFASPHCDVRPEGTDISLIVLHAISLPAGDFGFDRVRDLFLGCLDCGNDPRLTELATLRVSAHFVVTRDGTIAQFVPLHARAWHAGISCWQGRERCNDFSIGIELIGDESVPFAQAQYRTAAALCHALMRHFPAIKRDAITGHQDIAPRRKWDPGQQWSWARFRGVLDQEDQPQIDGLLP
ncbi:MAG: 1,6-anhydro-N-acetylmuramyl-L-alanine amidase AmpD [Mariprofundales bacterium]